MSKIFNVIADRLNIYVRDVSLLNYIEVSGANIFKLIVITQFAYLTSKE